MLLVCRASGKQSVMQSEVRKLYLHPIWFVCNHEMELNLLYYCSRMLLVLGQDAEPQKKWPLIDEGTAGGGSKHKTHGYYHR